MVAKSLFQITTSPHSLEDLYDQVIIPALSLAEVDRNQGALDEQKQKYIWESTKDIIEEVNADEKKEPTELKEATAADPLLMLCIPANDEADEICAMMLTQLLRKKGVLARTVSASSLANERLRCKHAINPVHPAEI